MGAVPVPHGVETIFEGADAECRAKEAFRALDCHASEYTMLARRDSSYGLVDTRAHPDSFLRYVNDPVGLNENASAHFEKDGQFTSEGSVAACSDWHASPALFECEHRDLSSIWTWALEYVPYGLGLGLVLILVLVLVLVLVLGLE